MGLCFTGSLAVYSTTMPHLSSQAQLFAWPGFMIAIILAAQFWGWLEMKHQLSRREIKYIACSIILLVTGIIGLALYL